MEKVDCIVIGAGVIGLACGRALALAGREVLILEREANFGSVTSARNSEVIHAGIYYPKDSLKSQLCVEGKALLYSYLKERSVKHQRCGKLIVATSDAQLQTLRKIQKQATANGVTDLRVLSAKEASALEPQLHCVGALKSPSTGILDSHSFMLSLLGEAENHGAELVCNTEVNQLRVTDGSPIVTINGDHPISLQANLVINSTGFDAPKLAHNALAQFGKSPPTTYYAKGSYFSLQGKNPFARLIYPVPEPGGLGIHLTLDLNGRARFGPDVEWVKRPNYRVDESRVNLFYEAIKRYWPDVNKDALVADYAGIRPKISAPEEASSDFRVEGTQTHGVPGLINLFGIESPGLTASLAIANYVVRLSERC